MVDISDRRPIGYLLQFSALILLVFAVALMTADRFVSAAAALGLAGTVILGWFAGRAAIPVWLHPLAQGVSLVVALLSLGAIPGWLPELIFWNLLLPVMFFLLWSVRWATTLTLVFVLAAILLAALDPGHLGPLRHQFLPALLLATLITGLFVYLREVKAQQLAPLRRTDTLTLASTQEHLHADLHIEIQRSEREGTALAVVHLALDTGEIALPEADQSALLRQLGRLLHEQLRSFDNYYRIDANAFVLILPCMDTAAAMRQADRIRLAATRLMASLAVDQFLSAGVTSLNVGDTADSLLDHAGEALHRAQLQGGNRTQSWTGTHQSQEGGL